MYSCDAKFFFLVQKEQYLKKKKNLLSDIVCHFWFIQCGDSQLCSGDTALHILYLSLIWHGCICRTMT